MTENKGTPVLYEHLLLGLALLLVGFFIYSTFMYWLAPPSLDGLSAKYPDIYHIAHYDDGYIKTSIYKISWDRKSVCVRTLDFTTHLPKYFCYFGVSTTTPND